jgi:hypothetical protein
MASGAEKGPDGDPKEVDTAREPTKRRVSAYIADHKSRAIGATIGAVVAAVVGFVITQVLGSAERALSPLSAPLAIQAVANDDFLLSSPGPPPPAFLIRSPSSAVGPPPDPTSSGSAFDPAARYAWAHRMGGVDAGETILTLTVSGTTGAATVLQQLRLNETCGPALAGTVIEYPPGKPAVAAVFGTAVLVQASLPVRQIEFELGRHPHVVEPTGVPFPFTVTQSDVEQFVLVARVADADCKWRLLLDWSSGATNGTVVISDRGKPFRTTASAGPGITQIIWNARSRRWRRRLTVTGRVGESGLLAT